MTKPIQASPAGYVPGAKDADGSEDPVPAEVLQTTDAAGAGKSRLQSSKQTTRENLPQNDDGLLRKSDDGS